MRVDPVRWTACPHPPGGDRPVSRATRSWCLISVGKTLIETRGEGGYVIAAPSRNGTAGWELLHGELRDGRLRDAGRVASASCRRSAHSTSLRHLRLRPSRHRRCPACWHRRQLDRRRRWRRLPPMAHVLERHGWEPTDDDAHGEHWTRPGKDPARGTGAASISQTPTGCACSSRRMPGCLRRWVSTTPTTCSTSISPIASGGARRWTSGRAYLRGSARTAPAEGRSTGGRTRRAVLPIPVCTSATTSGQHVRGLARSRVDAACGGCVARCRARCLPLGLCDDDPDGHLGSGDRRGSEPR